MITVITDKDVGEGLNIENGKVNADVGALHQMGLRKEVDLISKLKSPIVIAHRGGRQRFPEQSLDGMEASMKDGFLPEMDLQPLKTGEIVLLHDDTVNRTMTGASGKATNLTLEEWKSARIKPAIKGGRDATPPTFEQVLDQLGGRTVLVPEIKKSATDADVKKILNMITERGLERSVIVQSFSYDRCKDIVAAGCEALYLSSKKPSKTPQEMKNDGINFFSMNRKNESEDIGKQCKAANVKFLPYTVNDKEDVKDYFDGYFTDDPWFMTNVEPKSVFNFVSQGYGLNKNSLSGLDSGAEDKNTYIPYEDYVTLLPNGFDVSVTDANAAKNVNFYLDHLGKVSLPFYLGYRIKIGTLFSNVGKSEQYIFSPTFGFSAYKNTNDADAPMYDHKNLADGQYGITSSWSDYLLHALLWDYNNGGASSRHISSLYPDQQRIFPIQEDMEHVVASFDYNVVVSKEKVIFWSQDLHFYQEVVPKNGEDYVFRNPESLTDLRLALRCRPMSSYQFTDINFKPLDGYDLDFSAVVPSTLVKDTKYGSFNLIKLSDLTSGKQLSSEDASKTVNEKGFSVTDYISVEGSSYYTLSIYTGTNEDNNVLIGLYDKDKNPIEKPIFHDYLPFPLYTGTEIKYVRVSGKSDVVSKSKLEAGQRASVWTPNVDEFHDKASKGELENLRKEVEELKKSL